MRAYAAMLIALAVVNLAGCARLAPVKAAGDSIAYGWIAPEALDVVSDGQGVGPDRPATVRLIVGVSGAHPFEVWQNVLTQSSARPPRFHASDRIALFVSPGVREADDATGDPSAVARSLFRVAAIQVKDKLVSVRLTAPPKTVSRTVFSEGPEGARQKRFLTPFSLPAAEAPENGLPFAVIELGKLPPGEYRAVCELAEGEATTEAAVGFVVRPPAAGIEPEDLAKVPLKRATDFAACDPFRYRQQVADRETIAALKVETCWGEYTAYRDRVGLTVRSSPVSDLWSAGLTGWELVCIRPRGLGADEGMDVMPAGAQDGPADLADAIESLAGDWRREKAQKYPHGLPVPKPGDDFAVSEGLTVNYLSATETIQAIFQLKDIYIGTAPGCFPPKPILFVVYELNRAGKLVGKTIIERPAPVVTPRP